MTRKTKAPKKKASWCDRTLVKALIPYTLVTSPERYGEALEDMKLVPEHVEEWLSKGSVGQTRSFLKDGALAAIVVTVFPTKDKQEDFLTIVHEAVHVWQYQRGALCEESPATEEEAYAIEAIVKNLIEEYNKQTTKPKRAK